MIIEVKKIADLKPAPYNPRKATKKQEDNLKKSLEKFGIVEPIVFNKQTGCIVGGHFRIRELKKLGYTEVECVIVDLPIEDEKELNIRLNANTGEWDWDLIETEWDADTLIEWGLEMPEGDEPFGSETAEAKEDDFDTTPPAVAKTVLGDLYEIGSHRLLCADCTDVTAVDRLMGGERADMVFTDPPYGMKLNADYSGAKSSLSFFGEKGVKGGKKYDNVIGDHDDFTPELINTIFACFSDTKEIFIWGADYFAELIPDRNKGSWVVWDKRANGNDDLQADDSSDKMYGSCFELCWSKTKHKRDIARVKWAGIFGTEKEFDHKRHHPTQKPSLLAQWFFNKWGNENDLIADLYLGSGSTMVAAHQLKRRCFGMELSPQYTDVIVKRMLSLDSTLRVKRNGVDVTEEWRQEAVPIKLEATNK